MFKTIERVASIWFLVAFIPPGVSHAKNVEDYVEDLGIEGTYYEDAWSANDKIRRAKEQLRRAGSEAVPLLLSALEEKGETYRWTYDRDKDDLYEPGEEERRRKRVLTVLGSIGDPSAVPKLAEVATDVTENQTVRKDAVEALGRIGTAEALEVILSLKSDDDYEVREGVAYALRFYEGVEALSALEGLAYDDKVDVTVAAVSSLVYFDDPKVDKIACDLLSGYYYKVRLAALLLFRERRPNASYYKITALFKDAHPVVAYFAAGLFAGDGGVHSDVLTRKYGTAKDPIEKGLCIYAMGLTGDLELATYVDMASNDPDVAVRASYCIAAGFLYGPDRINEVAGMLDDNDEYVRLFALNGVENIASRYRIDDPDLIERCRSFLSKDGSYEPGAAAVVLAELGDGESIENIKELSNAKLPRFKDEDFHNMDALLIGGYSELEDFAGMMTAYIGKGLRNPYFFRYDSYYLKGGFIPARTFIWGPGAGEGTRIINYGNRFALKMVEGAALAEDTKDNFSYYRKRHIVNYNVMSSVVAIQNSPYDDFDYYKGLLGKGDGVWDESALRSIGYFDSEEAKKTAKGYADDEFTDVRIAAVTALARQLANDYEDDVRRARDKSESAVETLVCNIALAKFGDSEAVRLVAEDFDDIEIREDVILYSGYAAYSTGLDLAWDNYGSLLYGERNTYIFALDRSGNDADLERLLEIASTDPDPSIRWVALRAAERLSKRRNR